jgi:hypothetical protein
LALIRQYEWLNEPSSEQYVHMKGERVAEMAKMPIDPVGFAPVIYHVKQV